MLNPNEQRAEIEARYLRDEDFQVLQLWLTDRPINTRRAYRFEVEKFFGTFPSILLKDVTLIQLTDYAEMLNNTHTAAATKARALGALKSFFSFSVKIGYIKFNPAAAVRMPKINAHRGKRILTRDEVKIIIQHIERWDIRVLVALIYATGLRVEEAISVTWPDLTYREDLALLQLTVVGKGEKERTIVLNKGITDRLLPVFKRNHASNAPIFVTRNGNTFAQSEVWRAVRTARWSGGISKPVSAHWFRHAHASHALENGADLNLLRETLGHASLNTTGVYTHARPDRSTSQFIDVSDLFGTDNVPI